MADDFEERAPGTNLRTEAAQVLRELGHQMTSHTIDEALLERIVEAVTRFRDEVASGEPRSRGPMDRFHDAGVDEENRGLFPDSIVSGIDNPMGINARMIRDGEEAVLRATLRSAHQGAPGRAHGGIVAAMFDEAMGLVISMMQVMAFTGWLKVTYRAGTPLHEELEIRARMTGKEGRKISMTAEMTDAAGTLIAEAEALFIEVDVEKFLKLAEEMGA